MTPGDLRSWEGVLQSPVAVALLLFAAVCVTNTFWLTVVRSLWRENREQTAAFRDYLLATGDRFDQTVENVQKLIHLSSPTTPRPNDGDPDA
ncbi:hypothetical protein [Longimicrobium sp.]|uniref:hypothetical protein n=1 Tax=Longimicrobium sp. TaxID=2029185 RepID=UPI002E36412E|nr:hypothetical protein [Longimicrobium sp.]HEX6039129.1 hypothetical protein [Longimicrobium sp.]